MSKAVLVIDMPEQVCQKCTLCYETEIDNEYECCASGKLIPDGKIPDWCPLRELPERKEELPSETYEFGSLGKAFTAGFNACINEILGDSHE